MSDYGDMCKDLREMRREIAEQARLLGIGGTRESALMAKVDAITRERDEARAEIERLRKTLDEIATYWNGSHRPAETLDAAEWTRGVAEEALAATESKL
jgi:hypothetical protein